MELLNRLLFLVTDLVVPQNAPLDLRSSMRPESEYSRFDTRRDASSEIELPILKMAFVYFLLETAFLRA
jgi:hypothetical protein